MGAFDFILGKEGKTTSELAFAPGDEELRKKQLAGIETGIEGTAATPAKTVNIFGKSFEVPGTATAGTPSLQQSLEQRQAQAAGQLQGFQVPQAQAIGGAPTNIPQAQTQFNIRGAPANIQQAASSFAAPTLTAPDMSSVTQAQQQLAAVQGGLGAFQGGVSAEDMAALDAVQKRALARAAGGIGERLFAGGATTGGASNLGAIAASESAADFARQFAEAQRFGRTQQLEALGQSSQAAQALGSLGIDQGTLELNRQIGQGQLSAEAGRQALEAQGININAAMQAAQLAQQGDIAGAELALKGTGMNIDSAMQAAQINQQADIEKGRQGLAGAGLDLERRGQLAGILGQSPELQALNARLGAAGLTGPQVLTSGTGGREGVLGGVLQGAAQGAAGAAVMKCWIAEALYGPQNMRTVYARFAVNNIWPQRRLLRLLGNLYAKFGQRIARAIRRHPILRLAFLPVFELIWRQGKRWHKNAES